MVRRPSLAWNRSSSPPPPAVFPGLQPGKLAGSITEGPCPWWRCRRPWTSFHGHRVPLVQVIEVEGAEVAHQDVAGALPLRQCVAIVPGLGISSAQVPTGAFLLNDEPPSRRWRLLTPRQRRRRGRALRSRRGHHRPPTGAPSLGGATCRSACPSALRTVVKIMVKPDLRCSFIQVGSKEAYPVKVNQVRRRISHPYLSFPGKCRKVASHGGPIWEGSYIDQPSR